MPQDELVQGRRRAVTPVCLLLLGMGCADITAAAWTVTTIAGTGKPGFSSTSSQADQAFLANPYGIARGPDGALYVCEVDNHVIRKVTADNRLTLVAGTGRRGFSGDGGSALQAELNEPYEVRFDGAGHMFFVEMKNHLVRRVDRQTGVISTVAGAGRAGFSGDNGLAARAELNQPHSIQFSPAGDLFICDIGNHRIRKVHKKTGVITTFAGNGQKERTPDGARIENSPLWGPRAIDFDREGNLWLALREGNAVYKIDMVRGTIHHMAGSGKKGFTGHGGPAQAATLSGPKGLSIGPDGNVYLADTESHSIRRLNVRRGTLELVGGTGERGDGPEGSALACQLARPHGIFVDHDGTVYLGDSENHRVRAFRRR